MPESPKYQGVIVRLGGTDYTVPPLALGALKTCLPKLNAVMAAGSALTPELVDGFLDVVMAALRRNYPELQRETIEAEVDLGNMGDVMLAVTGASGLAPKNGVSRAEMTLP
jgi:hypothetical protein